MTGRLDIDFAPPGWRRTLRRTGPGAWLFALAALAAVAAATSQWQALLAERTAHEARLRAAFAVHGKAVAAKRAAQRQALTEPQAVAINAAIIQLNLPWRALREAVDEGTPDSVALLELEPAARRRSLRISAEARHSDDMVGYVERLKKQPVFTEVVITRHEIVSADPNRPIRFDLEARWRQ